MYGLTLIENGLGLFANVIGPDSVTHQFADKFVTLENSRVVGESPDFNCETDTVDKADPNYALSSFVRSWRIGQGGRVGVASSTFTRGSHIYPGHSFTDSDYYNSIKGLMNIRGRYLSSLRKYILFGNSCHLILVICIIVSRIRCLTVLIYIYILMSCYSFIVNCIWILLLGGDYFRASICVLYCVFIHKLLSQYW
jgi:hypothetical protein